MTDIPHTGMPEHAQTVRGWVATVPEAKVVTMRNGNDIHTCKFRLAIPNQVRNEDGEIVRKNLHFITVESWGWLAGRIRDDVAKGHLVTVTGHFKTDSWTDKDGNERVNETLTAFDVSPSIRQGRIQVQQFERNRPATGLEG